MSFVDVKDLREALSDIQHCLVYVFSIYEWKCVTSFTRQLSWCKYTYHVIRDLVLTLRITKTNVTSLHMLPENRSQPQRTGLVTALPRKPHRGVGPE